MPFVSEAFTGANGDNLTTFSGWAKATGVTGDVVVYSNRIRSNGATCHYYKNTEPVSLNYDVQCSVYVASATGRAGVCLRCAGSADTSYWAFLESSNVTLWRISAGSAFQVGQTFQTTTAGQTYTLLLSIRGGVISVYVDAVLKIQQTNGDITASGYPGVRFTTSVTDSTGFHLDNFTATDPMETGGTSDPAGEVDLYDQCVKPPDPQLRTPDRSGLLVIATPFCDRGNSVTADLAGAVPLLKNGPTWVAHAKGPCVSLNGTSQYIDYGPNTDPRFDFSGNLLVLLMVRVRTVAYGTLFSNQNAAGSLDQCSIGINASSKVYYVQTGTSSINPAGNVTVSNGDTLYIIMSREHTTTTRRVKLWVNGVLDINQTYTGTITAQSSCGNRVIGRAGNYVGANSYSAIDVLDCRVWKDGNIVTDGEVRALYDDPWRMYNPPIQVSLPPPPASSTYDETGRSTLILMGGGKTDVLVAAEARSQVIRAITGQTDVVTAIETGRSQVIRALTGSTEGTAFTETGRAQIITIGTGSTDQVIGSEAGKAQGLVIGAGESDVMAHSETGRSQVVRAITGQSDVLTMIETARAQILNISAVGGESFVLDETGKVQVLLLETGQSDVVLYNEVLKPQVIRAVTGAADLQAASESVGTLVMIAAAGADAFVAAEALRAALLTIQGGSEETLVAGELGRGQVLRMVLGSTDTVGQVVIVLTLETFADLLDAGMKFAALDGIGSTGAVLDGGGSGAEFLDG